MDLATLKLISDLLDIADIAARVAVRFSANNSQIKAMIAEGRDPTPAEWDALQSERDANTDIIENA